jgi:hypothetical protein
LQKAAVIRRGLFAFGVQLRIVVKIQHMETRNTPTSESDQKLCKWTLFLLSGLRSALHIAAATRNSASASPIALAGAGVAGGRQ